jgi:hypothetical protein
VSGGKFTEAACLCCDNPVAGVHEGCNAVCDECAEAMGWHRIGRRIRNVMSDVVRLYSPGLGGASEPELQEPPEPDVPRCSCGSPVPPERWALATPRCCECLPPLPYFSRHPTAEEA